MKQILIITDDPSLGEICQFILESAGYRAAVAYTGTIGIKEAKHSKPDLVLLEWLLPSIGGDQVFNQLREHPLTSHIPIIMMSAPPAIETEARLLEAEGFLAKPFDRDDLLKVVASNLEAIEKQNAA